MSQAPDDAIDPATFRQVFRQHAAGVAVVTVAGPDGPAGFTATSLTSVSATPPLLSIAVASTATTWPALAAADGFVVNLLGTRARDLATRFSTSGLDRFAPPTRWSTLPSGEPRLDAAHSWIHCHVEERIPAGDHHLVIGRVVAAAVTRNEEPLLYHDGQYHTVGSLPAVDAPVAAAS